MAVIVTGHGNPARLHQLRQARRAAQDKRGRGPVADPGVRQHAQDRQWAGPSVGVPAAARVSDQTGRGPRQNEAV